MDLFGLIFNENMSDKQDMAIILESPPYCPFDEDAREIWAILHILGYTNVKIVSYDPHVSLVFTYKDKEIEVRKSLDLTWAFREIDPLPLVKKVFEEINKQ